MSREPGAERTGYSRRYSLSSSEANPSLSERDATEAPRAAKSRKFCVAVPRSVKMADMDLNSGDLSASHHERNSALEGYRCNRRPSYQATHPRRHNMTFQTPEQHHDSFSFALLYPTLWSNEPVTLRRFPRTDPALRTLAEHLRRTSRFGQKNDTDLGSVVSSIDGPRPMCGRLAKLLYFIRTLPTRIVYRVAREDTKAVREALYLFPLRFADPDMEKKYLGAQRAMDSVSSVFLACLGAFLILLFWVGYSFLFTYGEHVVFVKSVRVGFHVGMGVALCGCVVFLIMEVYGRKTRHFSTITLLFLSLVCIGPAIWVLSTSHKVPTDLPEEITRHASLLLSVHHYIEVVSIIHYASFLLLISIFVVTLFAINSMLTLRSLAAVVAHGGLMILFTVCEVTSSIHFHRLSPKGARHLLILLFQIGTLIEIAVFWVTASVSLLTRLHQELVERIEYFRWVLSLELVEELQRYLFADKDVLEVAPVEKITQLAEELRHLVVSGTSGTAFVLRAQVLLDQMLHTLRTTDDLYSPVWNSPESTAQNDWQDPERLMIKRYIQQKFAEVHGGRVRGGTVMDIEGTFRPEEIPQLSSDPQIINTIKDVEERLLAKPLNMPVSLTDIDEELRENIGANMHYNILKFFEQGNQDVLQKVGFLLLEPAVGAFATDVVVLWKFLGRMQDLYCLNPYHNSAHAASVAHMLACLLRDLECICNSSVFGVMDHMIMVLGAVAHDLAHPGRTNSFFVQRGDPMAIIYNDVSVLENFHCAVLFKTLQEQQFNVLRNVPQAQFVRLRQLVVKAIMGTDMSLHFENITRGRIRCTAVDFNAVENEEDAWLLARLALKVADLGHAILPWDAHYQWSLRITEEFFQQGDEEKALNLPFSSLCNRNDLPQLPKTQIGFLEYVVTPLIDLLVDVPGAQILFHTCQRPLLANITEWTSWDESLTLQPEIHEDPEAPHQTEAACKTRQEDGTAFSDEPLDSMHLSYYSAKPSGRYARTGSPAGLVCGGSITSASTPRKPLLSSLISSKQFRLPPYDSRNAQSARTLADHTPRREPRSPMTPRTPTTGLSANFTSMHEHLGSLRLRSAVMDSSPRVIWESPVARRRSMRVCNGQSGPPTQPVRKEGNDRKSVTEEEYSKQLSSRLIDFGRSRGASRDPYGAPAFMSSAAFDMLTMRRYLTRQHHRETNYPKLEIPENLRALTTSEKPLWKEFFSIMSHDVD